MRLRPVLLLALLLAACRGETTTATPVAPPPTGAPGASPAPSQAGQTVGCTRVTEAEVSEAIGQPMRIVSPPGTSGCSLDSVPPGLSVEFMVLTRDDALFEGVAQYAVAQPVEGIGERALFVPVEGQSLAQLHVLQGELQLIATLAAPAGRPDLRALAERFGTLLAGRM